MFAVALLTETEITGVWLLSSTVAHAVDLDFLGCRAHSLSRRSWDLIQLYLVKENDCEANTKRSLLK